MNRQNRRQDTGFGYRLLSISWRLLLGDRYHSEWVSITCPSHLDPLVLSWKHTSIYAHFSLPLTLGTQATLNSFIPWMIQALSFSSLPLLEKSYLLTPQQMTDQPSSGPSLNFPSWDVSCLCPPNPRWPLLGPLSSLSSYTYSGYSGLAYFRVLIYDLAPSSGIQASWRLDTCSLIHHCDPQYIKVFASN